MPTTTTTSTSSDTPTATVSCPALPATITQRSNTKLPDPFTFYNGTKVSTKAQWACRQQEIADLLQRTELGTMPPKPQSLTASLNGNTLNINVSDLGKSISFAVTITRPSGSGPFPAMIIMGGFSSLPLPSGVASISYTNTDLAADSTTHGQGKFYDLYGTGHSAGALIAWAWGVQRIVDALVLVSGANINTSRLGVTGCSRYGKAALVAGAFEPRLALTIPQESGSGGAGCFRIAQSTADAGISTETAANLALPNTNWFATVLQSYTAANVNNMPSDHHALAMLVSPRGLLVIDNTSISWLGPRSVWGCMSTARKAWQALGVIDSMGVSQIGGHDHCALPSTQNGEVTAFVTKFLLGQSANTTVLRTDGANQNGFVESQWVDWTVPTLT